MSEQKTKYIVRVANTDLDGTKKVQKIKGVSQSLANAVCRLAGIQPTEVLGDMKEADVEKLTNVITDVDKIPVWMRNRQNDYETGNDTHLIGADLSFTTENDIKRLKKIKSNRGLRLQWGLTVRGQRTSSNHRRSKAKKASAAKKLGKRS
jgi:small subunit ribosomal protein S13